jgi:phosphatidylserine synthase
LFAVITTLSFFMVSNTNSHNTQKFNSRFMLSFGIRFLGYLIFALVYLLMFSPDPIHFIILFFILYLLFTILEVIFLIKLVKQHSSV